MGTCTIGEDFSGGEGMATMFLPMVEPFCVFIKNVDIWDFAMAGFR